MSRNIRVSAKYGRSSLSREVIAVIGGRYAVSPMNPRKLKHRGRTCVIERFDDDFAPREVTVRFDDNNRLGKVDVSDLLPIGPKKAASQS